MFRNKRVFQKLKIHGEFVAFISSFQWKITIAHELSMNVGLFACNCYNKWLKLKFVFVFLWLLRKFHFIARNSLKLCVIHNKPEPTYDVCLSVQTIIMSEVWKLWKTLFFDQNWQRRQFKCIKWKTTTTTTRNYQTATANLQLNTNAFPVLEV